MSLASRLRTHSAALQRASSSPDGMGGFTDSWSTQATLSCLVQPLQGDEVLSGGAETLLATHRLYVDDTPDIQCTDRVVVGSTTYEVVFVENAGGVSHHLEVLLREIE